MKKVKQRIPECGSMVDSSIFTMEQHDKIMKRFKFLYKRFVRHITESIKPIENAKVLEIGSGTGWAGIYLLKERIDIMLDAIEPSQDMIRVARNNSENEGVSNRITFIQGYAENLYDIPDRKYDLIISAFSLHHWENPEKVFREISRVLKPEGKIYILDFRRNLGIITNSLLNIFIFVITTIFRRKAIEFWKASINASYTPDEVRQMVSKIQRSDWIAKKDKIFEIAVEAYK